MEKLDKIIVKVLYYLCALLMFIMAVVITSQVISRYVLGSPLTWSEELGRYTFVWMSFLGMAVGIKHTAHIALDILIRMLTGVNQRLLILINNLFITLFAVVLTYSGFKFVELGSRQTSPSLNLPMEFVYSVIPVSGILVFYFIISGTIQLFRNKEGAV